MRRLVALATVALSGLALAVTVGPAGAAAHRAPATLTRITRPDFPATIQTVIRPVGTTGHARSLYTVRPEPSNQANCSVPDPAPSAVSPNIEQCSPSAASAFVCWNAAADHNVLCLRDPRRRSLYLIPRVGPFASTPLAAKDERAPLSLVLGNADYCLFHHDGTRPIRADHPRWIATYDCTSGKFVWKQPRISHYGVVERRGPSWTVLIAGETGRIKGRHVLRAWFVGSFQSTR